MILWQQCEGLSNKTRDDMEKGFKNYPKLRDVIYGQIHS